MNEQLKNQLSKPTSNFSEYFKSSFLRDRLKKNIKVEIPAIEMKETPLSKTEKKQRRILKRASEISSRNSSKRLSAISKLKSSTRAVQFTQINTGSDDKLLGRVLFDNSELVQQATKVIQAFEAGLVSKNFCKNIEKIILPQQIFLFFMACSQSIFGLLAVVLLSNALKLKQSEKISSDDNFKIVINMILAAGAIFIKGAAYNFKNSALYKIRRKAGYITKGLYFKKLLKVNQLYFDLFNKMFFHNTVWNDAKSFQDYYECLSEAYYTPFTIVIFISAIAMKFSWIIALASMLLFAVIDFLPYLAETLREGKTGSLSSLGIRKLSALNEYIEQIHGIKTNSLEFMFKHRIDRIRALEMKAIEVYLNNQSIRTTLAKSIPFMVLIIVNFTLDQFELDKIEGIDAITLIAIFWEFQRVKWRYYDFTHKRKKRERSLIFFNRMIDNIEETEQIKGAGESSNKPLGSIELCNLDLGSLCIDECRDKIKELISQNYVQVIKKENVPANLSAQNEDPKKTRDKLQVPSITDRNGSKRDSNHKNGSNSNRSVSPNMMASTRKLTYSQRFNLGLRKSMVDHFNKGPSKWEKDALTHSLFYYKDIRRGDRYKVSKNNQEFNIYLHNIKLMMSVKPGQKICLMGDERSGRRSFIEGIMGENYRLLGTAEISGEIGYLTFNENYLIEGRTIKENILFGSKFKSLDYKTVLKISNSNFDSYENGDETIVLYKGCNLLENDKMKIFLCRMLYRDADIYIIQDFFDMFKSKEQIVIFNKMIKGYLLDKTVLYMSNINTYVREADHIYIFHKGMIVRTGRYNDLRRLNDELFWSLLVKEEDEYVMSPYRKKAILSDALFENQISPEYLAWKKKLAAMQQQDDPLKLETRRIRDLLMEEALCRNSNSKKEKYPINNFRFLNYRVFRQYTQNNNISTMAIVGTVNLLSVLSFITLVALCSLSEEVIYDSIGSKLPYLQLTMLLIFFICCHSANIVTSKSLQSYTDSLFKKTLEKILKLDSYTATEIFKRRISSTLFEDHGKVETRLTNFVFKQVVYAFSCLGFLISFGVFLFPYSLAAISISFVIAGLVVYFHEKRFLPRITAYSDSKEDLQDVFGSGVGFIMYLRELKKVDFLEKTFTNVKEIYEQRNYQIYDQLVQSYGLKVTIGVLVLALALFLFPLFDDFTVASLVPKKLSAGLYSGLFLLGIKFQEDVNLIAIYNAFTAIFSIHSTSIHRFHGTVESTWFNDFEKNENGAESPMVKIRQKSMHRKLGWDPDRFAIQIEMLNVSFAGKKVLKNVCLSVKYGEKIALLHSRKSGVLLLAEFIKNFRLVSQFNLDKSKDSGKHISWRKVKIMGTDLNSEKNYVNPKCSEVIYLSHEISFFKGKLITNYGTDSPELRAKLIPLLSKLRILEILANLNTDQKTMKEINKLDSISKSRLEEMFKMAKNISLRESYLVEQKKDMPVSNEKYIRDPRKTINHRVFYKALISLYMERVLYRSKGVRASDSQIISLAEIDEEQEDKSSISSGFSGKSKIEQARYGSVLEEMLTPTKPKKMIDILERDNTRRISIFASPREGVIHQGFPKIPQPHHIPLRQKHKKKGTQKRKSISNHLNESDLLNILLSYPLKSCGSNLPLILHKPLHLLRLFLLKDLGVSPMILIIDERILQIYGYSPCYYLNLLEIPKLTTLLICTSAEGRKWADRTIGLRDGCVEDQNLLNQINANEIARSPTFKPSKNKKTEKADILAKNRFVTEKVDMKVIVDESCIQDAEVMNHYNSTMMSSETYSKFFGARRGVDRPILTRNHN